VPPNQDQEFCDFETTKTKNGQYLYVCKLCGHSKTLTSARYVRICRRTPVKQGKSNAPQKSISIADFPCIHRGEQIGTLDCGCSTPQIYKCSNPKTKFDTCIIRKEKPGRIEHNRCNCCEFIEQPGEESA
jgi:hypothetical protein